MFKTVLWATDGSAAADRALPYAKALVRESGGTLLAVHCREIYVGRAGGYPVLADDEELVAKIREQVSEARREGIGAAVQVIAGTGAAAAHVVADAARAESADVIVVGTRGHGAVAGVLLGSVTQRLLHLAPCPVLAVPAAKHAEAHEPKADEAVAAR